MIFCLNNLICFYRIRKRCVEGCSSGASTREEISMGHEGVYAMTPMAFPAGPRRSSDSFRSAGSIGRGSSLSRTSLGLFLFTNLFSYNLIYFFLS